MSGYDFERLQTSELVGLSRRLPEGIERADLLELINVLARRLDVADSHAKFFANQRKIYNGDE